VVFHLLIPFRTKELYRHQPHAIEEHPFIKL